MVNVQTACDADLPAVRELFREYAAWVAVDLSFQDFNRELAELPGDYISPSGVLLVARVGQVAAGCVAAHRWDADVCEMKRLYVREAFRGSGCGRRLVEHVVMWARDAGYRRILLDTLPAMDHAQQLYERMGFREIAPYRDNPVPGARFLALTLV